MRRASERSFSQDGQGSSRARAAEPAREMSETRRILRYLRGKALCVGGLIVVLCIIRNWADIVFWLEDLKAWENDMRKGPNHVHTRPAIDEVILRRLACRVDRLHSALTLPLAANAPPCRPLLTAIAFCTSLDGPAAILLRGSWAKMWMMTRQVPSPWCWGMLSTLLYLG